MTLLNARPITGRTRLFLCPKQSPLDEAFRFGGRPGGIVARYGITSSRAFI